MSTEHLKKRTTTTTDEFWGSCKQETIISLGYISNFIEAKEIEENLKEVTYTEILGDILNNLLLF